MALYVSTLKYIFKIKESDWNTLHVSLLIVPKSMINARPHHANKKLLQTTVQELQFEPHNFANECSLELWIRKIES